MPAPILYCGDTNLNGAASYLAGLMTHFGWAFDYVPSHLDLKLTDVAARKLFIFSDYPSARVSEDLQRVIVAAVAAGAGFVMIGGWESFHGMGGDWDGTPVGDILPVEISDCDDRVNSCHTALLGPRIDFDNLWELPWECPPSIGGWNSFEVKENFDATVMLEISPLTPYRVYDPDAGGYVLSWDDEESPYPALVVSEHSKGMVAAFASDVAPHWVGGFVDWGPERVKAQAAGASAIEVGSDYAQFWKQLLSWVGRLE